MIKIVNMTLDNGKTIIRLRIRLFIATILFTIYLFFAHFEKKISFPLLGLSETNATLILIGVLLLIAFYPMIFRYNYIYFSDDSPSIVIRFYSVGIMKGVKKSIEIDKKRFLGYKKRETLVSQSVSLIERADRREATYPPISITSLNKTEKAKLFTMLDRYGSEVR